MNDEKRRIGAVIITMFLIGSVLLLPVSGMFQANNSQGSALPKADISLNEELNRPHPDDPIYLDRVYTPEESLLADDQNDIGYNIDAGNRILKSLPVYIGEPIEEGVPGRGRTGTLDSDNGDSSDWYTFTACEGQSFTATVSGGFSYEFADASGHEVGTSVTADVTGRYFINIYTEGSGGSYTFDISASGQNDAGTGGDAGDSINAATGITPGEYDGYMSSDDVEDWYSFTANAGDGIFVTVKPIDKSDYDIHLYNPAGEHVVSALYYGTDTLEYPADQSGTWKIKLDIFPGWDAEKWPDNYFLYGSGAYELTLTLGGEAALPADPVPQPEITPIAQSFYITDDQTSSKDEFTYLAAIPAANYLEGSERYVSPIFYTDCDYQQLWFSTVDQTTQYLIDDWHTYLDRHGIEPVETTLQNTPVETAAQLATTQWDSSDTVVVTVDGSAFTDEIRTIADTDATMSSTPEIDTFSVNDLKDIGGKFAKPMFLGKDWCAVHVIGKGEAFAGDTGVITPKLDGLGEDWWPYPYDIDGEDLDTFIPVTKSGFWFPYVTTTGGLEELQVVKIPGDRYSIPITTTDCSIEVTVDTEVESNLVVFLIDPDGNIRAPMKPHYNGGDINPIFQWNGGHWQHDYEEFRAWKIDPHTEYSVSQHHPSTGTWTAIVVPYMNDEFEDEGFNGAYHISVNVRNHNLKRIDASMSAANAAVLASLEHAPLLYVTEDAVPAETSDAIASLGASTIIFANINGVSSADPGATTEYTTLDGLVDAIKSDDTSENFITITSLASGDGYFAPSAMAAAYHGGPVLNIGEIPDVYNTLDIAASWREYAGDYYHGCLSVGHLSHLHEPFDLVQAIKDLITEGVLPTLDLKLKYFGGTHDGIYDMISSYGLDLEGQEVYFFVADRDGDIRDLVCRAMTGNNSYAGHIPVPTAAWASDIIVRDILYPAIIYANPGRDVTTSQMMNFPDGWQWTTNDGNTVSVYSTRLLKESFSSHGRFFEGHCTWTNLLERYNTGAAVCYYSGHGTGGSGISAQYEVVNEQFPLAHLVHEDLKDYEFPDAWRGYMYDDTQTKTARWGGFTWYNAVEPNLYNLIHFKWVDELFGNLHSIFDLWMSCTTATHLGANVYLAHGAAVYYGNGGTGLCPQEDLLDDAWMSDMLHGDSVGEAMSRYVWLHQRDYTTKDPTAMYGRSSLQVTNVQMIFGDPTMTVYSPEWAEPTPVAP